MFSLSVFVLVCLTQYDLCLARGLCGGNVALCGVAWCALFVWGACKVLPGNPLDVIISELGGSDAVAELTGRKARMVRDPKTGKVSLQKRSANGVTLDYQNIHEKNEFMQGKKLVAVISEAASAGISLQADKRVKNQR